VAADVAFDALLSAYRPSELIALQYHLHIPSPDPLTNAASEARSQYYQVGHVPSTYFNGAAAAGDWGFMEQSEEKYKQHRTVIDAQLAGEKSAKIELRVARTGNTLRINAQALPVAKADKKDEPSGSQLRLRLALTERTIRYRDGNGLLFQRHVVRDFPGGVEGKPFVAGSATLELTVDLDELRGRLNEYLRQPGQISFYYDQGNLPAWWPKIELEGLTLVAFVQDDATKQVLDAVQVAVPCAE
jgi:hypothetical protein